MKDTTTPVENVPQLDLVKKDPAMEDEPQLKCFRSELRSVDYMTRAELFHGFDTIKAITFSYDISFIEKVLGQFKYAEIIFGAEHLVQKDRKLTGLLKDVLTNSYEAAAMIRAHKSLSEMLADGDAEFRTPSFVLDHRKIYLLKSDDGRHTRVITASANMSGNAWNGEHMEFYDYDDTYECYEEYERDFETAWINSHEIPYDVVVAKKDDLVDGNPIIKKVKETDRAIILQQKDEPLNVDNVKYMIDHEKIRREYGELLSDVKIKSKNGLVELIPKTIEKIEHNRKKLRQKYKVNNVTEEYPMMTVDYATGEVKINDEVLDLHPSPEEVTHDIDKLVEVFGNFDRFVGDSKKMKDSHFKMMNAIFASPFHAKLRCASKLRGIGASSLPLYLLAASSTANCGKTFMISIALKMMTGRNLTPFNKSSLKKDDILGIQMGCKGIPVFIDELDAKSFSYIKDMIKNPERCEDNQIETMPMLIFASNNILEPDEIFRKRMAFLRFSGRLPSDIDQSAYKNMGHAIIREMGTGFYREYLRRMVEKVSEELEYIITEPNIPGEYYPDMMSLSSGIIIDIFTEFGRPVPEFIRHLSWNDDYSINAKFISEDAVSAIETLYRHNRKVFTLTGDLITIELGTGTENRKKCESWVNTLPSEMNAEMIPMRDCIRVIIDRKEFEKRIGHRLGRFAFLFDW